MDNSRRLEQQIGYYHWVPLLISLQAILFYLPNWIWNLLNEKSGKKLWDLTQLSRARFSDAIDRLNCHIMPALLLFFVAMISTIQVITEVINTDGAGSSETGKPPTVQK
ncbi:hypothetical protein niasHS_001414 [Heterodera schachtii]|uniref:Innexin n=1 Tax=Heterodera schachtii TaxID=97005 RepID=A0ABD2KDX4_HETSC